MAYLLSSERSPVAAMPSRRTNFVAAWFAKVRAARSRRLALMSLVEMDDARLLDLGIERQDVLEAIRNPRLAMGHSFSAKRRRNAGL